MHEDLDRQPEGVEDVEERVTSATETAAEGSPEVQRTPARHCGLVNSWSTSSRINVQNLASFATPGEGCVTALIPMSKGNLLVLNSSSLPLFKICELSV